MVATATENPPVAVSAHRAWHTWYCFNVKHYLLLLRQFHSSELSCENVTQKRKPKSIETQIPQGTLMFLKPQTLQCLSHLSETPLNSEEIKFQWPLTTNLDWLPGTVGPIQLHPSVHWSLTATETLQLIPWLMLCSRKASAASEHTDFPQINIWKHETSKWI